MEIKRDSHTDYQTKQILGHKVLNVKQQKTFIYFFINLFILVLAALGLHCCVRAFSSCSERGLLFIAVRGLLIAVASLVVGHGLQACGLQQLWLMGSRAQDQQLWCTGLVAWRHVGSSRTRALTRVPCIGRRILNLCATREVQSFYSCQFFLGQSFIKFTTLFKEPSFGFIDFLYCVSVFNVTDLCSNLYYLLPLLCVSFALLYLVIEGEISGYQFQIFFSTLFNVINFPLALL